MTNIEKLQQVWVEKDLDGVLGMLTDDFEMRILYMDQTLKGPEAHANMKELVLDESVVSSDFRIMSTYANNIIEEIKDRNKSKSSNSAY